MIEEKETSKVEIGNGESKSLYYMQQLLSDDDSYELNISGEKELNKIKLSYIEFAKNSLNRIIKLTRFLEKLENKFIDAVDEIIDNEPQSIMLMTTAMDTLSKLIANSQIVIHEVLKDERLQNITINTTNIISSDGSKATVIDADSRDEIRNLAAALLAQLESGVPEESDQDIIDVEPNETKGD